jgi:hypothetical protein
MLVHRNISHKSDRNQPLNTGRFSPRLWLTLTIGLFWMALVGVASAQQWVSMAWDQSPDPSVAGYSVYYQAQNSTNVIRVDVGNNTQAVVTGLQVGQTYTFTVKAYNEAGVESAPSNPAVYVVPQALQLSTLLGPTVPTSLRFQASPGHWYEVQASTDLSTWTTIWQTGVANAYSWIAWQDPQSSSYPSRFYRVQAH